MSIVRIGVSAALVFSCMFLVAPQAYTQTVFGPESGLLPAATLVEANQIVDANVVETVSARIRKVPALSPEAVMPLEESLLGPKFLLLRFRAADAAAVRLHFEEFSLPADTRIYIYSFDGNGAASRVYGPFSSVGPLQSGEFWSPAVAGSEAIVEFQVDGEVLPDLPFRVGEVEALATFEEPAAQAFESPLEAAGDGEIRQTIYRGMLLTYQVRNGVGVAEGDIELGPAAELEQAALDIPSKRHEKYANAISSSYYRWPGGVIPYVIDAGLPNTYRVTDAVSHWNTMASGSVAWVPRTTEGNYVKFTRPSDAGLCSSNVGRMGFGVQSLNLGDYCSTGNAIHEMGHIVGFWHEHTRADRDTYVRINWANINPTTTYNFQLNGAEALKVGPYDYGSVMHYPANGFSINGQNTIDTIPAGIPIGQRSGLSANDIAAVKTIYPAATTPVPPPTTTPPPTTPPPTPTVSVTVAPNPTSVQLSVDGTTFSGAKALSWMSGTAHSLSAPVSYPSGSSRYVFKNWSDGGSATHTVTAPATSASYTADFSKQHRVTVTSSDPAAGTATISPMSADSFYADGALVGLKATPAPGYCFSDWSAFFKGTAADVSLSVTKPYDVRASFTRGAVTVSGSIGVIPAAGASGNLPVVASNGCTVEPKSSVSWITLALRSRGWSSSTNISYSVARNSTGISRTGAITVGLLTITVTQAGQ